MSASDFLPFSLLAWSRTACAAPFQSFALYGPAAPLTESTSPPPPDEDTLASSSSSSDEDFLLELFDFDEEPEEPDECVDVATLVSCERDSPLSCDRDPLLSCEPSFDDDEECRSSLLESLLATLVSPLPP